MFATEGATFKKLRWKVVSEFCGDVIVDKYCVDKTWKCGSTFNFTLNKCIKIVLYKMTLVKADRLTCIDLWYFGLD